MAQQPNHDHLLIMLGLGPKKPDSTGMPPSSLSKLGGSSTQPSTDNDSDDSMMSQSSSQNQLQQSGQKISRDQAGYIPAVQKCGGCNNYTKETGECSQVDGTFTAMDACKNNYQAANTSNTNDNDADDMNTGSATTGYEGNGAGMPPTTANLM